jgi:hypothetical protein
LFCKLEQVYFLATAINKTESEYSDTVDISRTFIALLQDITDHPVSGLRTILCRLQLKANQDNVILPTFFPDRQTRQTSMHPPESRVKAFSRDLGYLAVMLELLDECFRLVAAIFPSNQTYRPVGV